MGREQRLCLSASAVLPPLFSTEGRGSISRSPNAAREDNLQGVADAAVTSVLEVAVTPKSHRNCHWPYLLGVRWWLLRCSVGDAAVLITAC